MKLIFAMLMLMGITLGCGDDSTNCSRSTDCFKGEVCTQGLCVPDTAINASTNSTTSNSTTSNSTTSNSTTSNSTTSNSTSNSTTNSTTNLPDLACVVDPFEAQCHSPDDNDSFSETFFNRTAGCLTGDTFTAMDETRSAQLCSREMRDRYSQLFVGCDTKSFVMEVTFTPQQECDRSVFKVNAYIDGKNCDEPSEEIRCEELPNGGVKITAIVNPNQSVNSATFTVEALYENAIQFDYDLRWVMRE